jgi:hypothetical protein
MAQATKKTYKPARKNNYKTVVKMADGGNVSKLGYSELNEYIEGNYSPFITDADMIFSIWESGLEYNFKGDDVKRKIIEHYESISDYTEKTLSEETIYEINDWNLVRKEIDPETDEVISETILEEISSDNTYNFSYLGLVNLNWRVYHDTDYDRYFYVIMPHLGGDIRGNYGDALILEGNDKEELFYRFYEGFISGGASVYFKFVDGSEIAFDSEQDSDVFYFRVNESFEPTGMAQKYLEDFEQFENWKGDEFLERTIDIYLARKGVSPKMMAGGSLNEETPMAYIQILGYNEGKHFDLTDYSDGQDVIDGIFDWMNELNEKDGGNREEYEVVDYEGFGKDLYDEYMGANEFDEIIEAYEKYNESDFPSEVISEYKNNMSSSNSTLSDVIEEMDNNYFGKYGSYDDFGSEMVEQGVYEPSIDDVYLTDTDKRILAGEEADRLVEDMSFEDMLNIAKETNKEYENEVSDLEDKISDLESEIEDLISLQTDAYDNDNDEYERISEEIEEKELERDDLQDKLDDIDSRYVDKARTEAQDLLYDETKDKLENDLEGWLEDYGYDTNKLSDVSFLSVDYDKIGKDLADGYLVVEYDGLMYFFNNYERGGRLTVRRKTPQYNYYIVESITKKLVSGYESKEQAIEQRKLLVKQYPSMRFEIFTLSNLQNKTDLDVNSQKDYVELSALDKLKKVSVDAYRYGKEKVGQAQMFLKKNDVKGRIKRGARKVWDKTKQGGRWVRKQWHEADFGDGQGKAKFFADGGEVSARLINNFLVVNIDGKKYKTWFPNWRSINEEFLNELNKKNESLIIVEGDNGYKQFRVKDRSLMDIWLNDKLAKKPREILIEKAIEFHNSKNKFADGGGVGQLPPKGELTNKDNLLLKYQKNGSEYEFYIYEPVTKNVSAYQQNKYLCKNKDCPIKMTYNQFINYLYTETYLDDLEYENGGGVDLYKDATEKSKKEIEFLLNNGYTIEAYSKEDRDLVFGEDDNVIFATQGSKGDTRNNKEFALAYLYEDDDSGVMQIDKDLMDSIADGFSHFPVTIYTNAGIDLHSKNKGKYKNITFKRFPVKLTINESLEDKSDDKFRSGGVTDEVAYIDNRIRNLKQMVSVMNEEDKPEIHETIKSLEDERLRILGGSEDSKNITKRNSFFGLFEKGGESKSEYDVYDNKRMLENQANEIEHHSEELNNQVNLTKKVPAWIIAKMERATTDLSDITHYLDGENKMKRGGSIGDVNYEIIPLPSSDKFIIVEVTILGDDKEDENVIRSFNGEPMKFNDINSAKLFVDKMDVKYPYGKANVGALLLASELMQKKQPQQPQVVYYIPQPQESEFSIIQNIPQAENGGEMYFDENLINDFCITNLIELANDIQPLKYFVTERFKSTDKEYGDYKGRLAIVFKEEMSVSVINAISSFIENAEDCHGVFEQSVNVSGSKPNVIYVNLLTDKFLDREFNNGGRVYDFAPKKINLDKTKRITTNSGDYILYLITENNVYFVNEKEVDKNASTIMYNKKGELESDNIFASSDLLEKLLSKDEFEYIHPNLKIHKQDFLSK